jgi:heme/copper-type cytochrome/quinol oxidase subunit 3
MPSNALSLHLDTAPAATPRRPRVLLVGTAFASAGAAAVFASLLGVYLSVRADVIGAGERWLPAGADIPLSPGNMAAVTLLMSLVTIQWAVYAAARRDRGHAYLALGTTSLFGIAAIVQIVYNYTEWNVPLNGEAGGSAQAVLLFTITGAQVAMTIAGLIFIVLMAVRSLGGQFTGRDAEGLSAAALYWWVTVGIFLVIWYAVYITK